MKLRIVLILLFITCTSQVFAQTYKQCKHCRMDIRNDKFSATIQSNDGKLTHFGAIECLVNYLKTKEESDFKEILVTDYLSNESINVLDAYFLKSEAIPSPMGANLSAFSDKLTAERTQKEKGGQIFNWQELKERFVSSNFGAIEHSHHQHNKSDVYAPSGIMGDHLHPKGGLMVSLRYMHMAMGENYIGSDKISDSDIYDQYMVAPQDMSMDMYMVGAMYAPSDKITLMVMQNLVAKKMDLTASMMMEGGMMPMLTDFSTSSSGLGDLKIGALYGLFSGNKTAAHINTMFNIPIGGITNRGQTPMMNSAKLPYAMQLGSGTFDITFGGTLKGSINKISWGLQQLNTFRTGTNSEGYRFGNVHKLHSWIAYAITNKFSTSLRLSGSKEAEIKGEDSELNPMMVNTTNSANYGGTIIHTALGCNVLVANDKLVLGVAISAPVYQNYNGVFMGQEFTLNASAKYVVF